MPIDQYLDKLEGFRIPNNPESSKVTNFSIEVKDKFYRINGVLYRGGIYQVDLAKEIIGEGTQDEALQHATSALQNNEFHVADFPLYHSLFTTLHRNRESATFKDKIEEVRWDLRKKFFDLWLMTLTRITYKEIGIDRVIHNFGLDDQYGLLENMVGPDEWIKDATDDAAYDALLGTGNLQEINAVYKWITENYTYLWRVNNKPQSNKSIVTGFGTDSTRAILDCDRDPTGSYPALGVRYAKIKQ